MEFVGPIPCTSTPVREQCVDAMYALISSHVDTMARVVCVDVDRFEDKCAGLLANLVMDAHDGRSLRDPCIRAPEAIRDAEERGVPLSLEQQEEMAGEALWTAEYWQGNASLPAMQVFWNMLQHVRFPLPCPHDDTAGCDD